MRRSLIEGLERRKEMMIAALWANSGFEGDEGANARREAIESLEQHYSDTVAVIMSGSDSFQSEEENIEGNPFFDAAKKGIKKIERPRNDEGLVSDVIAESNPDYMDNDQA